MEFLRLPQSPHISALGGMAVAHPGQDIAFALQNPALMRPGLHNQLGLHYNLYFAGIKAANLQYGYHVPKINTSFALGIQSLNYGTFTKTDAAGNVFGEFRANDYAISLGASRAYGSRWRYGAALKFAGSQLYDKGSVALLADVGIVYTDTARLLTIGAVAKNMGATLRPYNPDRNAEPLPFDLQIGISKRFAHLPLRLMATIHHLYEWDIRYNNPADRVTNTLFGTPDTTDDKSYFADKLFRHFNFAAEFTLGQRISLIAGYNHLRRGELGLKEQMKLAGFSFGASLNLNKFQVHYARSYYYVNGAYNEFGLNMQLGQLIGLGKTGSRIGWGTHYPDWAL